MHELTGDEISLLHVYRVRRVKKGMGLTYDILRSELKGNLDDDLEIVLLSLLEKEILDESPYYRRLFVLTDKGGRAIQDLPGT